jgi:hypothetical protein
MFEITMLKLLEMDQTIFIEELLNKSFTLTDDGQKKNELTDDGKVEKEVNKNIEVDRKESHELNKNLEDSVNTNKDNEDLEDNLKIDIDYVKNKWSDIVTTVTNFRTSIGIVMEHSMPIEVEKSVLKVGVYNQPKFSLDLLNNNKQVIEEIIIKQLDKKVALNFSDIQEGNDSIEINEKPLKNNTNKDENSDAMDTVIELFDGEILR